MQRRSFREWYRGELPPGCSTPLQLLMIQSTSFCNIDCSYCYLPQRSSKARFDLQLLPTVVEKLDAAGLLAGQLTVSWHAGEPLVLPVAWYREAKAILDRVAPSGVSFRHSFQTNAMLVTDEYCALFREIGALVGVSLDGPQFLHDARRTTRDGKGTFERAMAGIERLRAAGVRFSAICVLTERSLDHPDELYDFFHGLGVTEIGFNVEEIEGTNTGSSLQAEAVREKVGVFYRRILQRVAGDQQPLRVREVESGRQITVASLFQNECGSSESNPLSIISIDTTGKVSTFSPELLQVPGQSDAYTFGDIRTLDFTRIWENPRFVEVNDAIRRGVEACRTSCAYFGACGGGAPANKLAENGRFDSTETMHCRLTKQALVDMFDDLMAERLKRRRQARRTSPMPIAAAATPAPQTASTGSAPAPSVKLPRVRAAGSGARVLTAQAGAALFGAAPAPAAAPATLEDRLFPYFGAVNVYAPPERLRLSPGTQPVAEAGFDPAGFKPGALAPRQSWRRLSAQEHAALAAPSRSPAPLNFVTVVRLPAELQALARELGVVSIGAIRDRGKPLVDTAALQSGLEMRLRELFAEPGSQTTARGVMVNKPGVPTVTDDLDDELLWGLHLDSWSGLPPESRADAVNRLAVNCGASARRLQVLDIGLDQIAGLLGTDAEAAMARGGPTELGREFMRRHPNYPVISIEILPGEAYVATTENLIHDGSTVEMDTPDAVFTLIGRFTRARALPHAVRAQAEPVTA